MGQPGKVQTTLLTPVDVMKADWLSKGNRNPDILAIKPPRPKYLELAKDVPEYIVDPGTKTTYLKGKFLGKGGFGRAYELTDLTTGQVYAGKIISKSNLVKPHQKEKEKIFREIELHRRLQHKNVVRFHRFFKDEHNVYIILENCSRQSLDHVLKTRKYLTEPEVRYFMLQLAEGVKYIHSCGIIHRDLKLGNMFLSEEMDVKIGDFGLATCLKTNNSALEKTTKNGVCGTPNYISPEVLTCQGYCFGSDVWAMGCIMYAMLVGQPPFESASLNETYNRIAMNKYSIPSSMSQSAKRLVTKMLQLKPSDRLSLDEILDHEFFTSGLLPVSLPPSCCVSVPKITAGVLAQRSSSEQNVDRLTSNIVDVQLSPKPDVPKIHVKSEESSPMKFTCFPPNLRQKLTNVLCPDKIVKKTKEPCISASMYTMVQNTLDSMPPEEDCDSNPVPLSHNLSPFITKWIDYSNKYGFGFQLSDHTFGVLFNDATRISLSASRTHVEFRDNNGKISSHTRSNVPSSLNKYFTLLEYFSKYMDENLAEGGELQSEVESEDLVRIKIPHLKRWIRATDAIIMQLNSGTLQINFFEDHTKIVISGDGTVMYIDEDRRPATYSLAALIQEGCKHSLRSSLQYAASVLQDFAQLEGDSL